MSQEDPAVSFAHRENIERYKRILRTHLTEDERVFIQRRLAEEQAALEQLAGTAVPFGKSNLQHEVQVPFQSPAKRLPH